MLVKVKLLGKLGQLFGREYDLEIASPAEAIRLLCASMPGMRYYIENSEQRGVSWRVVKNKPEGISELDLHNPFRNSESTLVIAPIISGAGSFGRIILGTALLVGSFFMPASIGILGLVISSTTVGLLGASLIIGGLAQMLSPQPKTPKNREEKKGSILFNDAAQPGRQGMPVPVGYGLYFVTDMPVLSAFVTTIDLLD